MTDSQWSEIETAFAAIHALGMAERARHLAEIEDEVVRSEVMSLLDHAGNETSIGQKIAIAASQISFPEDGMNENARRFGPYRVVRRIGAGGQGAVFEAIRDDATFEQRVAVKVVNWEVDDEWTRARLREERQILARLEHPNITRLIDGGETSSGSPYFVMEYVAGRPLNLATENWPFRQKLRIFLEILDAVAYAHRNLIIHRDLKPGNIMVSDDGKVKLLDFGIARPISTDLQQTQTAFRPLSPGYASPEQVRGMPISTSSDIYSLGVVLYELLTGRRPYKGRSSTPAEIDRAVCEEPPAAPELGDELDDIVLMALRKEPERRYGSATQFADDIRRYLERRPVSARPDTLWYRTRKYAQRHWLGLSAVSVALLGVMGGTAAALYQAHIAELRFQEVRTLAHSFVFDYYDDLAKLEGSTAVREKMVRTALTYIDNLARTPGSDPDLQKELAAAYRKVGDTQGFPAKPNLGHVDQAITSYKKAARLYDGVLARDKQALGEVAEFYAAFTSLLTNSGDYAAAKSTGEKALGYSKEWAAAHPEDESAQIGIARILNLAGDVDDEMEQGVEALKKFRQAEAIINGALKTRRSEAALQTLEHTLSRVATGAQELGNLSEAEAALNKNEEVLAALIGMAPANPTYRHSESLLNQFRAQLYADDLIPSFQNMEKSLPFARAMVTNARREVARDEHDAAAKFTLAIALYRVSYPLRSVDVKAAVDAARESLEIFDEQMASGKSSYMLVSRRARAMLRLSEALQAAGNAKQARAMAAQAFLEQQSIAVKEDPKTRLSVRMVTALLVQAQAAEAERDMGAAKDMLNKAHDLAGQIYKLNTNNLQFAIPLARTQESLAEFFEHSAEPLKATHWRDETRRLWRNFPQQSEFVQDQLKRIS